MKELALHKEIEGDSERMKKPNREKRVEERGLNLVTTLCVLDDPWLDLCPESSVRKGGWKGKWGDKTRGGFCVGANLVRGSGFNLSNFCGDWSLLPLLSLSLSDFLLSLSLSLSLDSLHWSLAMLKQLLCQKQRERLLSKRNGFFRFLSLPFLFLIHFRPAIPSLPFSFHSPQP